ncbi:MAG: leucine-rich repeat domain-containing protein [Eubacterium sp.]|nr:leucine-rich repeat domain-containing protein [Eubacterium sp.]
MACIDINSKVLCNLNNENISAALNEIIDTELSKDVSRMNTALIDECVNALLEIEKEENRNFAILVPLQSSNDFLKAIKPRKTDFKALNVFARASLIAAILAASAVTANAAYKSVTGVNMFDGITQAIQARLDGLNNNNNENGIIQLGDDEEDDETAIKETTTETVPSSVSEPEIINITENSTSTTNGRIDQLGDDEEDDETTEKPASTRPSESKTTEKASIVEPQREPEKAYVKALEAEFKDFKYDYVYGESLSYDGLKLYALYSDSSRKEVALEETDHTKSLNMNVTADYTLRVIYENCVVKIKITVRPDEETRGAETCKNDDFDYFLTKRGAYITNYKGNEKNLNIAQIDSKGVYAIGAEVFKNSDIETVIAPNVKKLFSSAFENCENLKTVVLNNSITYLGESVFKNSAIEEIDLSGELTSIPKSTFENCKSLKKVTLPQNTKEIQSSAFSECEALETVNNTNSIETAQSFAFYNCAETQTDSNLPKLKKAGEYAFAYCKKIDFGKLSEDIEEFDKYSFAYCSKLTEVTIPNKTTVIPEGAFRGAHISTLNLPEGLKEIDDYAFMSTEFRELNVPDSVERVGTYGLYSVRLRSISFGKNISHMGESAIFKSTRLSMSVYKDTAAYDYAIENKINYTVIE